MVFGYSLRGFEFDPGDPSVGMFGDAWIHEACPVWGRRSVDLENEVDERILAVTRTGPMTERTWYLLTCRDCAQQVIVHRDDYAPTEEVEAEMERDEEESMRQQLAAEEGWIDDTGRLLDAEACADALLAAGDDDPNPYHGTYSEM